MAKRNGTNQSFSLRRIILQRARFTENRRNFKSSDVESGVAKFESFDKGKSDTPTLKKSPSSEEADNIGSLSNIVKTYKDSETCCIICCLKQTTTNVFYTLDLCNHVFCTSCLVKYLKNEINESRTDIACPQCSSAIHPNNIYNLLKDYPDVKVKYEDFMIRRYLLSDPDSRWCPAPNCSYAVIATGCASCPQLQCGRINCGKSFCYHCKAEWHPDQTCDSARNSRRNGLHTTSVNCSRDSAKHDEIKPCPRCQVLIVKMNDGSCNHMVCSVCGAEFCWLCMKEVSDLHYFSPSGCTFWGKKPWSRKKKIVWQIGTLIGAPVGIALLAGIAIPSMVIGIPVWVARKLLDRYKTKSKYKRNMSVTLGVVASVLISPVLAGLAIAIGVPILLFYVYGVVPVSLCRAGCGATTLNEDFKFETNIDENKANYNIDGTSSIDEVSRNGELSIGDVSLSVASGSLIEVVHNNAMRNSQQNQACRESTMALAGSVKNKTMDCHDNISIQSTSILTTYSSDKSVNLNDSASIVVLNGSLTS